MQTRQQFLEVRRNYHREHEKKVCLSCGVNKVSFWMKIPRCRVCFLKIRKDIIPKNIAIIGWFKGKKRPPETGMKISRALRGRKLTAEHIAKTRHPKGWFTGENNPRWKGGISIHNPRLHKAHLESVRRARKFTNGGSHTYQQWLHVKAFHAYLCAGCGNMEPFIKISKDHIMPLSKGGNDGISNIQPMCLPCNSRKQAKIYPYDNPPGCN